MHLIDFHKIESLSRDQARFQLFLTEYMQEHDVQDTLRVLKLASTGINKYDDADKALQDKRIIELVDSFYFEHPEIQKWKNECEIINMLFQDLSALRQCEGLKNVPAKRQSVGYLIVLEIYLGSIQAYVQGLPLPKVKEVYPFVISLVSKEGMLPASKDFNQLRTIMDAIAESAGYLLKYFFREWPDIELNLTVNYDQIKILREHASLYDKYDVLSVLEEKWRMFGMDISQQENTVEMKLINEATNQALSISKARFQSQRRKWALDFQDTNKEILLSNILWNNPNLVPEGYISEAEAMHAISLGEFLSTRKLNMQLKKVELREWLRAYSVIIREMDAIIEKRLEQRKVNPIQLTQWCSVKHRDEWLSLFTECGISATSATIIIDSLSFKRKSKDLLDCPFIPSGDLLIVIPSLARLIDPAISTISNMASSTTDISLKGHGMEHDTLKKLRDVGIACDQIKTSVEKDTYECDVFFVLDNVLFFVECKSFGQPYDVRQYYELMLKICGPSEDIFDRAPNERSATEQLNRIVDFYMDNLHLIRNKLGLSDDWNPTSVVRMILTTAMMGDNVFSNGCYVMDLSTFSRFINRDMPSLRIGPYKIMDHDQNYEGTLSFDKWKSVMCNARPISILANRTELLWRQFSLQNTRVKYNYHKIAAAEMYQIGIQEIEEMIKRGVLPPEAMQNIMGAKLK